MAKQTSSADEADLRSNLETLASVAAGDLEWCERYPEDAELANLAALCRQQLAEIGKVEALLDRGKYVEAIYRAVILGIFVGLGQAWPTETRERRAASAATDVATQLRDKAAADKRRRLDASALGARARSKDSLTSREELLRLWQSQPSSLSRANRGARVHQAIAARLAKEGSSETISAKTVGRLLKKHGAQ